MCCHCEPSPFEVKSARESNVGLTERIPCHRGGDSDPVSRSTLTHKLSYIYTHIYIYIHRKKVCLYIYIYIRIYIYTHVLYVFATATAAAASWTPGGAMSPTASSPTGPQSCGPPSSIGKPPRRERRLASGPPVRSATRLRALFCWTPHEQGALLGHLLGEVADLLVTTFWWLERVNSFLLAGLQAGDPCALPLGAFQGSHGEQSNKAISLRIW